MAAALLLKAGGELNVLKLTKLLYLIEREAMHSFGFPLADDRMVAMPNGPVLSHTLDLTNGNTQSAEWESLIEDRAAHQVRLKKPNLSREEMDELSDAALNVIEDVWSRFGHMNQWKLVEYTHDHCAEWDDPGASSLPIPEKRIFAAFGKTRAQTKVLVEELNAQRYFESLLNEEHE